MEMLNYSLWFTLIWWIITIILIIAVSKELKNIPASNDTLLVGFGIIPAIAILLEYLIVR